MNTILNLATPAGPPAPWPSDKASEEQVWINHGQAHTMHTKVPHSPPQEALSMGSIDYNREAQPLPAGSLDSSNLEDPARQSPEDLKEENRKIRRLQMVVNMVSQVIAQDSSLSVEEASEMVADTRRLALGMFPDKELAFNLIYWPRLQRLMRERFRMQ
jgi:hypothetical protein